MHDGLHIESTRSRLDGGDLIVYGAYAWLVNIGSASKIRGKNKMQEAGVEPLPSHETR